MRVADQDDQSPESEDRRRDSRYQSGQHQPLRTQKEATWLPHKLYRYDVLAWLEQAVVVEKSVANLHIDVIVSPYRCRMRKMERRWCLPMGLDTRGILVAT